MSPRRSWNGFRDDKVKFTHPRADICCVFTKRHLPLWITERFPFFFFFSSPVSGRTLWNIAGKSIFGGACMIEGPSWWDGDTSAAMCHQSFSSDDKSIHHGRLGGGCVWSFSRQWAERGGDGGGWPEGDRPAKNSSCLALSLHQNTSHRRLKSNHKNPFRWQGWLFFFFFLDT